LIVCGAPGVIRTLDLVLRRHTLYPSELRAHGVSCNFITIRAECVERIDAAAKIKFD
jgi:hypothetical protein